MMSELAQLAALDPKSYSAQIKARLRDNEAWLVMLDPALVDRTRLTLMRIIASIDAQKARADETNDNYAVWIHSINVLRRYSEERLSAMAPPELPAMSSSKEAQAWRALSANLAIALDAGDPDALDVLKTPYGNLTAREWLAAREQKKGTAQ